MRTRRVGTLAALTIAAGLAIGLPGNVPAPGTWTMTSSMSAARDGFGSALLPDGRVLVAGGWGLSSAEIYDPSTGTWSPTASMRFVRANFTLTAMKNGWVLAAGGNATPNGAPHTSCEVYIPSVGRWRTVRPMSTGRYYHSALALDDGSVMVSGGCSQASCGAATATTEIFDPRTGGWSDGGTMMHLRDYHTSTSLRGGGVLVTGGYGSTGQLASAERWDPATRVWTEVGPMNAARSVHAAARLRDGRVLVIGGQGGFGTFLSSCELYDPIADTWTATGSMADQRQYVTASRMADGRVLVSGGWVLVYPLQFNTNRCEIYDPVSGAWTATGTLHVARSDHGSILLRNGQSLIMGGLSDTSILASAELYTP